MAKSSSIGASNQLFLKRPKDGANSALKSVDIYEVKRSQRHQLAPIENNWFGTPINQLINQQTKNEANNRKRVSFKEKKNIKSNE